MDFKKLDVILEINRVLAESEEDQPIEDFPEVIMETFGPSNSAAEICQHCAILYECAA